ncbi:MAG: DMT family transporter [Bdellovibrionales bacterium]
MSRAPDVLVKPNDKVGIFLAVIASAIFGFYPPASRAAYADGANATFVLFFTTIARALMLSGFCWATGKPLFTSRENTKQSLIGGFWQGVSATGILTALVYLQGPIVLTILYTATIMLLFFMVWKGEMQFKPYILASTLLVFAGLTYVLDLWSQTPAVNWIGVGLSLVAAFAAMNRMYVYGSQMKYRNPAVVGAESFIVASFCVLPVALWQMPVPPHSLAGWGWTSLSALSLGIGILIMFYGIAMLGAFKWSLFIKIEPVFTSIFSVLFLGEYMKPTQYLGVAVVVGGLATYQVLSHLEKKPAEEADSMS